MSFNYEEEWAKVINFVEPPPSPASSGSKPPVYFIFSGMGSQYLQMGKDLYEKIPNFRESIQSSTIWLRIICEEICPGEPVVELVDYILEGTKETFDNVLHAYVTITSIQIALAQCLGDAGIVPAGIIGHSIGEYASACVDKSLTFIEALYISFTQGYAILKASETHSEKGAMAAVMGPQWEQIQAECPEGVYTACHNAPNIITIAGAKSKLSNYVALLESRGHFVMGVESSGQAFHCPFMEPAAKIFEDILVKAKGKDFGLGKERSAKWISTSVSDRDKGEAWAKTPGLKYWVNNMISPVLFYDAVKRIPQNAVVIEIAPHSLLLPILKRTLPGRVLIGLMDKNEKNSPQLLLKSFGTLYSKGLDPDAETLFVFKEFDKKFTGLINMLQMENTEEETADD